MSSERFEKFSKLIKKVVMFIWFLTEVTGLIINVSVWTKFQRMLVAGSWKGCHKNPKDAIERKTS